MPNSDSALRYRDRATNLRALAWSLSDPTIRSQLIDEALHLEAMAAALEAVSQLEADCA
jgi:hypothetical protein